MTNISPSTEEEVDSCNINLLHLATRHSLSSSCELRSSIFSIKPRKSENILLLRTSHPDPETSESGGEKNPKYQSNNNLNLPLWSFIDFSSHPGFLPNQTELECRAHLLRVSLTAGSEQSDKTSPPPWWPPKPGGWVGVGVGGHGIWPSPLQGGPVMSDPA